MNLAGTGSERLKSGITWKSILGLLYTLVVLQPAVIYIYLVTGQLAFTFVQWAALILFVEISRLMGSPLTKQEAALIFLSSWLANQFIFFLGYTVSTVTPVGLIYPLYFRNSDIASRLGLVSKIPTFYALASYEVWIKRTFFDPAWFLPILIVLVWLVLMYIADVAAGLFARQIYIETEKLPFPTVIPTAQACITLVEREKTRFGILCACALIGMVYGALLYGVPFISRVIGYPFAAIPIPWSDYNTYVHLAMPGASLGIATDIALFSSGFIVPFNMILAIFVGSVAIYVIGNHVLYRLGLTLFATEFISGMSIMESYTRSLLYAWTSVIIGVALAVAVVPLVRRPDVLIKAFRIRSRSSEGIYYPLWVLIIPYIAATAGISFFAYWLVPSAPLWFLLIVNTGLSFFMMLVLSRSVATAVPFSVPYPRELSFMIITPSDPAIWFLPTYIGYQGEWVSGFKIADLTDLHPSSYIKATSLLLPLALLFGFVYVVHFWSIAPIPSETYPGIEVTWKAMAVLQSIFLTRSPEVFRPLWLAAGFIISAVLFLITDFFNMSALVVAGTAGLSTPMPVAMTMLMGGILGRILQAKFGEKHWNEHKGIIAAGLILGEGVVVIISVCIVLLYKSMWILPY